MTFGYLYIRRNGGENGAGGDINLPAVPIVLVICNFWLYCRISEYPCFLALAFGFIGTLFVLKYDCMGVSDVIQLLRQQNCGFSI